MKALLLAAGKSTRIHPVAGDRPKPMVEVGGMPVLEWNLRWLAKQGIRDLWINLHHQGDQIEKFAGNGERWGVRIQYSREDPILGTAGAAAKLRNEWGEPFLVIYGDNITQFKLDGLERVHQTSGAWVTVAIYHREKNPNCGIAGGRVVMDEKNAIIRFLEGEKAAESDSPWVNAGVYLVSPKVLDGIPENQVVDFGRDVFPRLLREGLAMAGYPIEGCCLAIDTPEAYQRAQALIQTSMIP